MYLLQDVVVLGGGAFACEAMREAVRNGARTVTTVTRHNTKYGQPQFLLCGSHSQLADSACLRLDRRMHEGRPVGCAGGSCHSRGSSARRR